MKISENLAVCAETLLQRRDFKRSATAQNNLCSLSFILPAIFIKITTEPAQVIQGRFLKHYKNDKMKNLIKKKWLLLENRLCVTSEICYNDVRGTFLPGRADLNLGTRSGRCLTEWKQCR